MRMSKERDKVCAALVAAAAELRNPPRTADNPFYHSTYAPLDRILDAVRPVLAKHRLALLQEATYVNNQPAVITRIVHESGQFVEGGPFLLPPGRQDPQGWGGAITYARRYTLEALLGITGDTDDDAHYATGLSGAARAHSAEAHVEGESAAVASGITIALVGQHTVVFDGVKCWRWSSDGSAALVGSAAARQDDAVWIPLRKRSDNAPTGAVCRLKAGEEGQITLPMWMLTKEGFTKEPFASIWAARKTDAEGEKSGDEQ